MKNLLRVLRESLRHPFMIAVTVVCSLAIAALWGANLGTVYPLFQVVFRGQSLHQWMQEEIAQSERNSAEFQARIAALREEAAGARGSEAKSLHNQRSYLESRYAAEQKALATARWAAPLLERYTPGDPFTTLVYVIVLLLIATAVKDLFLMGNLMSVEYLAQGTTLELRNRFFTHFLRTDLQTFHEGRSGELISRFTHDTAAISGGIGIVWGKLIREPLKMFACLFGAAFICWRLLLLSLVVAPTAFFLMSRLAASIKRANRRALEEMSRLYARLTETFTGFEAVKAFGREEYEQSRFRKLTVEYFRKSMRIVFYDALTKPTGEIAGLGVICLSIVAGGYLVLNQETHLLGIRISERPLDFGSLMAFYALLAGVSDPARKMNDVIMLIQRSAAASDRVFELLDNEPKILDPPRPKPIPRPHGRLALEGVSFHYREGEPVLRDISLAIEMGETVAIVGPNGCGKTTLINLLLRFFDPTAGAVKIGGIDLRETSQAELRGRIALVTQQKMLFDESVLENIRYGAPRASEAQILAAARRAHADGFISRLEQGYDTVVGERGSRLSGGQAQRIALARAMVREPEILILDEATSAIDPESEQLIHDAIAEFARGRTTIMITHRLSTLELAGRIVVMDGGRVVDQGTRAELSARCELFNRLYQTNYRNSA